MNNDDYPDDVIRPTVVPETAVYNNHTPVSSLEDDDDEEDIMNAPEEIQEEPEVEENDNEDILEDTSSDVSITMDEDEPDVVYPADLVDLRGEPLEDLRALVESEAAASGPAVLSEKIRDTGSWENILFRAIVEPHAEEIRIQEALSQISNRATEQFSARYKDPETGKTLLRTSAIAGRNPSAGEVKSLVGDEAILAFENRGSPRGGGYRIPLYNSGITVDVITPTGNDIQTMLTNCLIADQQLGSSNGAHYFTYADLMYKTQIIRFIQPLIVNSSYADWRKKGKLWSIIKITDLHALVMTIAAICYKEGFDGFVHKCTRPKSETHPEQCKHVDKMTVDLFKMIVTRFSAMNKESIDFMVSARTKSNKNTLTQIAKYQEGLGLEGERLTFGDMTLTMRIPTIAEHQDAGAQFLSDIVNEIEGDNTEGQYEQFGLRYIRTFLPWIASIEAALPDGGVIKTSDPRTIVRELEKFDDNDPDNVLRNELRKYINKVQLTYVGYPATECPSCGYVADTPSGMLTFDPFSVFFTLAFLYLTRR